MNNVIIIQNPIYVHNILQDVIAKYIVFSRAERLFINKQCWAIKASLNNKELTPFRVFYLITLEISYKSVIKRKYQIS